MDGLTCHKETWTHWRFCEYFPLEDIFQSNKSGNIFGINQYCLIYVHSFTEIYINFTWLNRLEPLFERIDDFTKWHNSVWLKYAQAL